MTTPGVDNSTICPDDNDETIDAGTATGDDQADGKAMIDGNERIVTAVLGTDWMTELGTYDGTLVEATITADGDEPIEMTYELGSDETHEAGTTTGDEKLDGITIDDGMKTNDDVATVETTEAGTVITADDGTDDGTLVASITANPFDDNKITWVDGNELTTETATITGDDQADGIVTDDGSDK
jgi:hypothetical protein